MDAGDPPPVRVVNESGKSRIVLVCEHASNWMPPEYARLGLPAADLQRHIAWDIGALDVALRVSQALDAALVVAGASRLLIDLNRPIHAPSSIPELSESTVIPGNLDLPEAERQKRIARWFTPFQTRLAALLDQRVAQGGVSALIAVHSFTPVFLGQHRPWRAGMLYRRAARLGAAMVQAMGGEGQGIAHNQPYQIDDASDYTIPVQGEARGLDAVLVELRQDLIATPDGVALWAAHLAAALRACLPDLA